MTPARATTGFGRLHALALAAMLAACVAQTLDARQPRGFELYDQANDHISKQEWQQAEQKLLRAQQFGQGRLEPNAARWWHSLPGFNPARAMTDILGPEC